jgi:diacylglycerol kinase
MLDRIFLKFRNALKGLLDAVTNDFGFRFQMYLGVTLLFIIGAFFTPISPLESLLIFSAYMLVLITELQNTAIETALNHIHPERAESIRKTKDMTAGAVLLAGVLLVSTLLVIYFVGV